MNTLLKIATLSLSISSGLLAQLPPVPGLPGVRGGTPEGGALPPSNLTQGLGKPDKDAPFPGALEFPTATAQNIAAIYQNATGKRVIIPTALKDVQFSMLQPGGMTNGEVAELIEQIMLVEGYRLVPYERNPNIVTLLGTAQTGSVNPVRVITEPSQLSLETGVVTYIMKFQYLKPDEAQRIFTSVYGQLSSGGTITGVANASSLVVTEKAALIENLLKLKKEIDVPTAELGTDWVEVLYADVQELAVQLNEMFNSQGNQNQSAGVQRTNANRNPAAPGLPNVGNTAANAAGEDTPPQIIPDSRTNRIFLMGRPSDLLFIRDLVAQWDVKSSDRNFLRRKLQFLPVVEFMTIAESAIASTLGGDAEGGASSSTGRSTSNASDGDLGNNQNNNPDGGNASSAAALGGSDGSTQPESVLVGNTLLVADNVANAMIVRGPPHHIELVEGLIDQLDVRSNQVEISAVFGRWAVNDGLTFGVNLGQILNGNGIGFGTSNGGGGSIIENGTLTEFTNLVSPGAGFAAAGVSGEFGAFVNALEAYTRFEAFARPTIVTTNNREARISSGTQIAIPTNTFTGAVNGGQSTNFEYRDVALELLVRPLVNSEDEITLQISIVRDTIGNDRQVGELAIPDLLSDQLETIVTVPVGSAVLLGGLIDEDKTNSDTGVPVLRAIPILGNLFKATDDAFNRNELVIMIRPSLLDGSVALENFHTNYDRTSNLSRESRQFFDNPRHRVNENGIAGNLLNRKKYVKSKPAAAEKKAYNPSYRDAGTAQMPLSPLQQSLYNKRQRR